MKKEQIIEEILEGCRAVRRLRPLVHMIPNYVTAGICADAISAVGGRPLMASAPEEMEEITSSADGLVVNQGQPSQEKYRACRTAMETAAKLGLPVLFDPVGAGASRYRRDMDRELADLSWSGVIKGNSSEIRTVLTGVLSHEGVDSLTDFENLSESSGFFGQMGAQRRCIVLAATGALDRIFWRDEISGKIFEITLNHEAERKIILVGTGCIAGAVGGTLLAAARKKAGKLPEKYETAVLTAAAVAMTAFAGEEGDGGGFGSAACPAGEPGSFARYGYGTCQMNLLNRLSMPDDTLFCRYLEKNLELKEE